MNKQNYCLTMNVLNFRHKQERVTAWISQQNLPDSVRLSVKDRDFLSKLYFPDENIKELYTTFANPAPDSIAVTMATSPVINGVKENCWSFSFLKKYYSRLLSDYFISLGFPSKSDFVSDTEVWIPAKAVYPDCKGYRVFTLRVQFNLLTHKPELVVIAGEVRSVFNMPVTDAKFSEIPDNMLNRVVYKNRIFQLKYLSDAGRRNQDEVYPCLNNGLMYKLNMKKPAPVKGNRYVKYSGEIEEFKNTYLQSKEILSFIDIDPTWVTQCPERLDMKQFRPLQFGTGVHAEPKYGMKQHGPKHLVTDEVIFFFIMHYQDTEMAFTLNDYFTGVKEDFKGGLNGYTGMRYKTEPHLSITFQSKDNPLPETVQKLEAKKGLFDSAKKYVAIYLSPHSKWTTDENHKAIYYRMKEELLRRGIYTQTIEVEKTWDNGRKTDEVGKAILNKNFRYSLPNIVVAILAKLGGTPWALEPQETDELVIGISAYKPRNFEKKYLGSAFSFTNEGRFQGFNCYRSNQISELAGSIIFAVKEYCDAHKTLQRLVIHFYKNLSWKELKPIEKGLAELNLKVPVLVVSVNKKFSDDLIGFNLQQEHKMPFTGTYLPYGKGQYLLYNNQLVDKAVLNDREGYPFPLKISTQKFLPGSEDVIYPGPEEVNTLFDQVCRFSQLYWKSVSRQWMPVTLRYPEMLAQIVPHFKYPDLPALGTDSLWFL